MSNKTLKAVMGFQKGIANAMMVRNEKKAKFLRRCLVQTLKNNK